MEQSDRTYVQRINDLVEEEQRKTGKKINDIAKDIGISAGALSNYRGQQTKYDPKKPQVPNLLSTQKIANYFHVSLDYLVGDTNIKTPHITTAAASKKYGLSENALQILALLTKSSDEKMRYDGSDYQFSEALDGINWIFDTEAPVEFFSMVARYAKKYYDHSASFSKEAEDQGALGGTPDNPVIESTVIFSKEQLEAMQLVMIQMYLTAERDKGEREMDDGKTNQKRKK